MPPMISFDVDDTLLATRSMSVAAYAEVGVVVPEYAHGQRWQAWLPDLFDGDVVRASLVHRAKTQIYREMLETCDIDALELPASRLAWYQLAGGRGGVLYVTAASHDAAHIILRRLGILGMLHANLTYAQRVARLLPLPDGTPYVDDNARTVEKLRADLPKLNVIHYTDQTFEQLRREANV